MIFVRTKLAHLYFSLRLH